jgi:hypothetical protein
MSPFVYAQPGGDIARSPERLDGGSHAFPSMRGKDI